MAVFTTVSEGELSAWLAEHYELGRLVEFRGISSGIENSNFFVTTDDGSGPRAMVLTLFERLAFEQLPYYLYLMQHLAERGVTVPAPVKGRDNQVLRMLNGKPATLVSRLPGKSQMAPDTAHCAQVGAMLARMHLAGVDYTRTQPNLRGLKWWQETIPVILPHVDHHQATMLESELSVQLAFHRSGDYAELPGGPCHCDLFRDNALFDEVDGDHKLGGFFDFYFAGCDKWLFDVAVTVNDWCIDPASGALDAQRVRALLDNYHRVRPFTAGEANNWRTMLRAGALRFWISRLWDYHLPREAHMLQPHDPSHFERVLTSRMTASSIPWL